VFLKLCVRLFELCEFVNDEDDPWCNSKDCNDGGSEAKFVDGSGWFGPNSARHFAVNNWTTISAYINIIKEGKRQINCAIYEISIGSNDIRIAPTHSPLISPTV
jgi:hypothetical protein